MNNDRNFKIMSIVFLAGLFLILILCLFIKDAKFSETENRLLAQVPKFDFESLIEGDYTKDFEKYASDTVAFRDFWVKFKNTADFLSLKKDNGYAYFGKESQLFPIEEIDGARFIKNAETVKGFMETSDIPVSVLLAPTANWMLASKLPKYVESWKERSFLEYAKETFGRDFVDTSEILEAHSDKYIYYKTDHHWTSLGAYFAYSEIATHLGFAPVPLEEFKKRDLSSEFSGSTEAKVPTFFSPKDEIWAYENGEILKATATHEDGKPAKIFDTGYLAKRDKYSYFLGGNYPFLKLQKYINEREKLGNAKSVLVIKDSYANCLVPLLLEHYQTVYVVDLRHYRKSVKTLISDIRYSDNIELSDIVVLYNIPQFSTDVNVIQIAR